MVDYFESGYAWQTFNRFERRFLDALEYVPLQNEHDNVWSPIFRELLTQTCAEIDTFFRNMASSKSLDGKPTATALRNVDKLDIEKYRQAFESIFELSTAEVTVRDEVHTYDKIKPFEAFLQKKSPQWWQSHNDVKHNWAQNYVNANLRNTLCSLGGLFLLNVLHHESKHYLVMTRRILTGMPNFQNPLQDFNPAVLWNDWLRDSFKGTKGIECWAETRLFYHKLRVG